MKAERPNRWLLLCGVFAAILGLKVYLIHRFGTDLPYWDQWAREGDMMIARARDGTLHLADLFVPHSEHRIVPTLALCLGLEQWSGQWDARVECVVNAVIHTAVMVLLVGYVFRAYSRGAAIAAGWLQLALVLTALDWENTLASFQSQFYFLIGFSLVAMWGMIDPRGWAAPRWWCGLVCGGMAMISMGSGLICFVPVVVIAAVRLGSRWAPKLSTKALEASATQGSRAGWTGERTLSGSGTLKAFRAGPWVPAAATVAVAAGALLIGWLTRGRAPWDDPLHAKRLSDFLLYFVHCLAWPARGWPGLAALVWIPWVYFAIRQFGRYSARQELLFAAGLWVLLQIAAVSFYRGADGGYPADRYADVWMVGIVVNLLSWFELQLVERDLRARWARPRLALLVVWLLIIAVGGTFGGLSIWRTLLPSISGRSRVYEENVGLYLRTGDVSRLHPPHQIPFPDVDWFKRIIDRPSLRAVMPVSVGQPAIESSLSAAVRHFCGTAIWLFWGGILLLLGVTALTWRRTE